MSINRRGFVAALVFGSVWASIRSALAAPFAVADLLDESDDPNTTIRAGKLAILQGATSADTSQIAILAPRGVLLRPSLTSLKDRTVIEPVESEVTARDSSPWAIQRFAFKGLEPRVTYRLDVLNTNGELIDQRTLNTLDLSARPVRWAFISCIRDLGRYVPEQRQMWNELLAAKPEFIISTGDNVYVDDGPKIQGESQVDRMWRRWAEARNTFEVFKAPHLVPYLATWDDHDFGQDNTGASYPFKREAAEIMRTFFAQEEIPGVVEPGPGVSTCFSGFGQRFFLMDDRTWRSPNDGSGEQTHWGPQQEAWLRQRLQESDDAAWILNGSQFFGGYMPGESYERNHPASFRAFLNGLKGVRAPVLFGSGDRHFAEVSRIEPEQLGYETYEILSSGLATNMTPGRWVAYPNLRQIAGKDSAKNFMIVESTASSGAIQFKVTAYGPAKRILFSRDLSVKRDAR